jgi:hypothetical protein
MTVLAGGGIESETHLPYAGLQQLVRPVLAGLDHLPAPQARALRGALGLEAGAGDEWFLVSLAALSLLAEAAEEAPLLCVVDDAHCPVVEAAPETCGDVGHSARPVGVCVTLVMHP